MKKVLVILGARPNFVKVARFAPVAAERGIVKFAFVHTGQQRDHRMTEVFARQFGIRMDHILATAAGGQLTQLSSILSGLEPVIAAERPHMVMVVGDVTSTLAGALAANKMGIPLAHLESGLRSGDRTMPEEMNRLLTDRLADMFFTTEPAAEANLLAEGMDPSRIHFVGNTMIDTMVAFDERIQHDPIREHLGLGDGGHILVTMHRPSNVDDVSASQRMLDVIERVARHRTVVMPLHPRTTHNLERNGGLQRLLDMQGLKVTDPMDYFAFQNLLASSAMVMTDSGGVQEETTFRGVPCLTLRPNTERPITVTVGTNELVPFDVSEVEERMEVILAGQVRRGGIPERWDGHATERVVEVLENAL